MKSAIVFCFVALCAVAFALPHEDGSHYPDKWDGLNIKEILHNDKLLDSYYKCLMDEGKCPPEGKELRSRLPDALETHCAKCTDAQREGADEVISFFINHKPEMWKKLKEKHDPTGKFSAAYEEDLKKIKEHKA